MVKDRPISDKKAVLTTCRDRQTDQKTHTNEIRPGWMQACVSSIHTHLISDLVTAVHRRTRAAEAQDAVDEVFHQLESKHTVRQKDDVVGGCFNKGGESVARVHQLDVSCTIQRLRINCPGSY